MLREKTVQLLKSDWKRFRIFVDLTSFRTYYKTCLKKSLVQGSNVEIIDVTEIYKILLSIYSASESQIIRPLSLMLG
jgi:hypothetical protein